VSAGKLDQRVRILRREAGVSSSGSGLQVEDYPHIATVWAQVTPLRGGESFTSQARFASATHSFRIRHRTGIDTSCRLEWRGEQYDVIEALPAGLRLREWLDVIATASPTENAEN